MYKLNTTEVHYRTTLLSLILLIVVFLLYEPLLEMFGNDKIRFLHFAINLLIVIVSFAVTIQFWFSTKFNRSSREIYLGSNYFLMSLLLIANFSVIDYSLKVPESNMFRIQLVAVIDCITLILLPFGMVVAHRRRNYIISERHRIAAFIFPIVAAIGIYGAVYVYFFVLDYQFSHTVHVMVKLVSALIGVVLHLMVINELRKYYDDKVVKIYQVAVLYTFLYYIFFMYYQNIFDASYLLAYLAELMAIFVIFRGIYYLSVQSPYVKLAAKNEEIARIAFYDESTTLPNEEHVKKYLGKYLEQDSSKKIMLIIELDRLEFVRAALGTVIAEELFKEFCCRLTSILKQTDYLGRLNSSQLMAVVHYKTDVDIDVWQEKVFRLLEEPFEVRNYKLQPHIVIGAARYPLNHTKANMLRRYANQALIETKRKGAQFEVYEQSWNSEMVEQFEIENDLATALRNEEIYLEYQPQYSLRDREIIGAEALIRWKHPFRGNISPEQFVPILERSGMIAEVGTYVLKKACIDAQAWERQVGKPLIISVNLSLAQLLITDYVSVVKSVLNETKYDAHFLKIEITESTTMNIGQVFPVLRELRKLGVKIAIDDFGTGYSSLSYLFQFPVDVLKIDRSFVVQIGEDEKGEKVLTAIINMAQSLGFEIVAEGIEEKDQLSYLAKSGCDIIQGYIVSKPILMSQLIELHETINEQMKDII